MTSANPIRIVIEPSDYVLRNLGDMAMMEVAVTRLAAFGPMRRSASCPIVRQLSLDYGPNVTTLDSVGRSLWLRTSLFPSEARIGGERLQRFLRVHAPR